MNSFKQGSRFCGLNPQLDQFSITECVHIAASAHENTIKLPRIEGEVHAARFIGVGSIFIVITHNNGAELGWVQLMCGGKRILDIAPKGLLGGGIGHHIFYQIGEVPVDEILCRKTVGKYDGTFGF